jgi:hypothetical protein
MYRHIIKGNIDEGRNIKLCYVVREIYITENNNVCRILYLPEKFAETKLRRMKNEDYIQKLFYKYSSASEATDHVLDG